MKKYIYLAIVFILMTTSSTSVYAENLPGCNDAIYHNQPRCKSLITNKMKFLEQKLFAADGENSDRFGYSVAISGDTVVIGVPYDDFGFATDQGSVYIFVRNGSAWTMQAKLFDVDGARNDLFGESVAIYGDTVAIGAPGDDILGDLNEGLVHVYIRSGGTWSVQANFSTPNAMANDRFGSSVAICNNMIVGGAPGYDDYDNDDTGSVFVFERVGTSWTYLAQLFEPGGQSFYGASVAIDGDTILMGGPAAPVYHYYQGAVVVYRYDDVFTKEGFLFDVDGEASDEFGASVAISGDIAIIGAPGDDSELGESSGSAYIFKRNGTVWSEFTKLMAYDGARNDFFGSSVAIHGDLAVIGAWGKEIDPNPGQGAVYVFSASGSEWENKARLVASDGYTYEGFGNAVALSGTTILVGADWADIGSNFDQGGAYLFTQGLFLPIAVRPPP